MTIDFKAPRKPQLRRRLLSRSAKRLRVPLAILLVLFLGATFLFYEHDAAPEPEEDAPVLNLRADLPPAPGEPPSIGAAPPPPSRVIEGEINPGDTIGALLGDFLSSQELHDLATQSRKVFPLSGICAGKPYKICIEQGALDRFEYDIDANDQLIIARGGDGFEISRVPIDYTVENRLVRGTITANLFEAMTKTGEGDALAMALGDIFAWDIDFIRDLRAGDSFQVLVEKRFREGKPAGYGTILAAEFVNQGKSYRAFYYKDGNRKAAYYDANGNSLKKAFLKAPLAFSRISSGFTMRRFHPISKTWKAHPAIDYAAPTGTPIMAIGDGTIIKIGYTQYNGNHIKIRHNGGLETLYLHMSKFAKGMKAGKKLSQGDVIGYVGSTGLATGPHLCFRMTRNGAPVNPASIKSVAADPIGRNRLGEFKSTIGPYLAMFENRDSIQQAQAPQTEDAPKTN